MSAFNKKEKLIIVFNWVACLYASIGGGLGFLDRIPKDLIFWFLLLGLGLIVCMVALPLIIFSIPNDHKNISCVKSSRHGCLAGSLILMLSWFCLNHQWISLAKGAVIHIAILVMYCQLIGFLSGYYFSYEEDIKKVEAI